MQSQRSRGSVALAALRPIFSLVVRACYGLLNRNLRARIGRIPGVFPFYRRLIKPLLFPPPTEEGLVLLKLPEFRMYFWPDEISGDISLGRVWEPSTTLVFRRVIRKGDTILDVGAHLGYFSLLASTICGDSGRVFAFEPHPQNYSLLKKNISLNGLTNITLVPKAVSNESGTALLREARRSSGHTIKQLPAWLEPVGIPNQAEFSVETVRLDEFFATHPVQPRLVKIDIEGAEPDALEGMRHLLKSSPEIVLVVELNSDFLCIETLARLLEGLGDLGFGFATIDDEGSRVQAGSPKEVEQRFAKLGQRITMNLLAAKERDLFARIAEKTARY
jgi:FkbM family methyltransferase